MPQAPKGTAVLKDAAMTGRLNGLALSLSLCQRYVNDSDANCEFVYVFPLPWGASLLDLQAELAGRKLAGTVVPRRIAEQDYEKAIDEGDAPIMVSQSAAGLYTANIGNIKPGEEAKVEVRYAQLLHFEQGHLSLRLPTVIAPRYGDPHAEGGLAPHETDEVDPQADYSLTLRLEVAGELAGASLSSPSHRLVCQANGETLSVTLAPGARLDRDVVINFDKLNGRSFALSAPDKELTTVLASFCPDLKGDRKPAPLSLKILVDCSGSMGGDSMAGAKTALRRILSQLGPQDKISYSRFGSHFEHDFKSLTACDQSAKNHIGRLIDRTEADMGGTEMNSALLSAFNDIQCEEERADLLLITDGQVWDTKRITESARQSGHRLFAIGVGSAPAESLLREMAEKTGGACEFISPRDDFAAATERQLNRLKGSKAVAAEMDWGAEPLWETGGRLSLFDGETIHVFAAFEKPLSEPPRLRWRAEGREGVAVAGAIETTDNPDLRRLAGGRRLEMAANEDEALALALEYQLVSSYSSLFLALVREDGEKARGLPVLRRAPQMRRAPQRLASIDCCLYFSEGASFGIPTWIRSSRDIPAGEPLAASESIRDSRTLLACFDRLALNSTDFAKIIGELEAGLPPDGAGEDCLKATDDLARNAGLERTAAWALLLSWLADRLSWPLNRQAKRLLRQALAAMDESSRQTLSARLDSQFSGLLAERANQD